MKFKWGLKSLALALIAATLAASTAQAGRFLSPDPKGAVDGPNVYGFCGGDPVNRVDPMGTEWVWNHNTNSWVYVENPMDWQYLRYFHPDVTDGFKAMVMCSEDNPLIYFEPKITVDGEFATIEFEVTNHSNSVVFPFENLKSTDSAIAIGILGKRILRKDEEILRELFFTRK